MVIEILEGSKTLNEFATQYELLPKNLQNWKKQFLENASLAFDKSEVTKEYKDKIEILQRDKNMMARKVGEITLERDFAVGKLQCSLSVMPEKKW
ncbi:MAG: transposase [Sulfurospirillum sp.]|nr:transposase [Sulfurospirillum sp.]